MSRPSVAGTRVLVVEDEALVVMMLEDMLEQLGCEVVGVATRLGQAKKFLETRQFDCALLDINLAGEPVYPLARRLSERGTPFVFVTGYERPDMLKRFQGCSILRKPFDAGALGKTVARVMSEKARGHVAGGR